MRDVPQRRWGRLLAVALALTAALTAGWEMLCRQRGFGPTLDDNPDLWAETRRRLDDVIEEGDHRPLVLIGDSRMLFDADLDEIERGLGGPRPIQLSTVGTNPLVILEHLASDADFDGIIVSHVHPGLYFAPPGAAETFIRKNIDRYESASISQRAGALLYRPLDERLAFLNPDELALRPLIDQIRLPQRAGADDDFLPDLCELDGERRGRMLRRVEKDAALLDDVRRIWMSFPRPPPWSLDGVIARDLPRVRTLARARKAVEKLRAHGGDLVYVTFPASGELKKLEDTLYPRAAYWDALLEATDTPGVHYADHPELRGFECPEWSHLSADDSVEFSRRLAPHLKRLLENL